MKKHLAILLLMLLLVILSTSRMLWMDSFRDQKQEPIKDGHLDLRDWNAEDGDVLLLDGKWEFYPSQRLIVNKKQQVLGENEPELIQVPGGWNEALNVESPTPYGVASYRLRIYVNPEMEINYSIRVPSVRSSSEVYVNGRLLASSGQVAEREEEYIAKNLPYSTTFIPDESGVIDLVIQAANYSDSRKSGIIRSIKFGSEEAIEKEIKISTAMQFLVVVLCQEFGQVKRRNFLI